MASVAELQLVGLFHLPRPAEPAAREVVAIAAADQQDAAPAFLNFGHGLEPPLLEDLPVLHAERPRVMGGEVPTAGVAEDVEAIRLGGVQRFRNRLAHREALWARIGEAWVASLSTCCLRRPGG